MRVLVQRVASATVSVDGHAVAAIRPAGQGLLALVGVTHGDDADKAGRLAEKLWQLRILDDDRSASDVDAPIMVVSQFTLYADTAKGRRPSWNVTRSRGRRGNRNLRRPHAGRIGQRRPGDHLAGAVRGRAA
jgi:D-tyrosyl-tRNA(Tyr) deacylase